LIVHVPLSGHTVFAPVELYPTLENSLTGSSVYPDLPAQGGHYESGQNSFVGTVISSDHQASAFAQGPSGKGFDSLLCIADVLFPGGAELKFSGDEIALFGGQVRIVALTDVQCTKGGTLCQIQVQVFHGESSSTHTLTFLDENQPESDSPTCGDSVVSVTSP
jgi:hypothetical protein